MDPKPQTVIEPVHKYVRAGFVQRMQSQFRAPGLWITSPDAMASLKSMLGEKAPTYPYMFFYPQSDGPNTESYTTNRLARFGIPVTINNDGKQFQTARLLPMNFETEVTFITNDYEQVEAYRNRWMFTRRNGALNFNINYGQTTLTIGTALAETISVPKRDNPADQESVYQVVANVTIHGYISEPALNTRGRVIQVVLGDAPALKTGQSFFPFN